MKRIYSAVFMVSASAIIFEVSLMRLFSIHLWYHFAFMVISIAMLGTGSAGTILYVIFNSNRRLNSTSKIKNAVAPGFAERLCSENYLSSYAALSGVLTLISYVLSNYVPFDPARFSWDEMQLLYLFLYCLILSLPFFFTGVMFAAVFIRYNKQSASVYGFDLIGAGTGSVIVLTVLNLSGPEYAILISSTLGLAGSLLIGKKHIKLISSLFIVINLFIFIIHPDIVQVKISPYKGLPLALTYPGANHIGTYHSSYSRIDSFTSPAVRFAPGLSLKYTGTLPRQIGLAIDAGRTEVLTDATDRPALEFLKYLPSSAAHEIANKGRVLVIDPKGGLHLLMAKHYGFKVIHGIESNPLLVSVIRDNYNSFSGEIYNKDIRTGYARNFLNTRAASEVHNAPYDMIDIPLEGISISGLFGISEDFKYTVEAFTTYLNNLDKDGLLSISLYLVPPSRTELKIISTITAAFNQLGIQDQFQKIAAIRSWDSMTILIKKSSFTMREIDQIKSFSKERRFDLVYYPGISTEETNIYVKLTSDEYLSHFNNLLNSETASSYINNYLFDIKPAHDNNPFFHYYLKLTNIRPIYDIMGQKWLYFMEEGYLLPLIFIVISALSALLIISPLIVTKAFHEPRSSIFFPVLVYFSMLGTGFMFVEVTLIQKSILLLENPSLSVGTILTALLISSGIGSLISSRHPHISLHYSIIILCVLLFIFNHIHPFILSYLLSQPLPVKIFFLSLSLFPLGFFMGIPFPMGIKLIGQTDHLLIPWAWAINACLSVLAPILATMLAIGTGFNVVLWGALLSYFIALVACIRIIPDRLCP